MGVSRIKVHLLIGALLLLLGVGTYQLIKTVNKNVSEISSEEIADPYLRDGQQLSVTYCSSCHLYPQPNLLPKRTWKFETLLTMAPFLGVDQFTGEPLQHNSRSNPYVPEDLYPDDAMVTSEEWQKIQDYYYYAAPDSLPEADRKTEIITDALFFEAKVPAASPDSDPIVTAVNFDTDKGYIFLSNSSDLSLRIFDDSYNQVFQKSIESPISHIAFPEPDTPDGSRKLHATHIGDLFPSDAPYGVVKAGSFDPSVQEVHFDSDLVSDIARPVQTMMADITNNGQQDLLVSEFGHRSGRLFLIKNAESQDAEKQVLIETPGCIQSHIMDFTGNGLKDILTLCTQYDQSIYLIENRGKGRFNRKALLQFDVTAGSSSFEIHDFNGDGLPDILYTSGDNADYSQIFKPYHGVYIYLNQGDSTFENAWFYPVNGAYNAKARDFTGNGYLDIAVISFFADYENSPEEGFLFFKGEEELTFTPYHHPETAAGRWLTMDVADWTGNGRYDIILGNSSVGPFGPSMISDKLQDRWKEGPYFMVLENHSDQTSESTGN